MSTDASHIRPPILANCIGFVLADMDRAAWGALWPVLGDTAFTVRDRYGKKEEDALVQIIGLERDDSMAPDLIRARMRSTLGNGSTHRTLDVVCEDWKLPRAKAVPSILIYPASSYVRRQWCTIAETRGGYYYRRHGPAQSGNALWIVDRSRTGVQKRLPDGTEEPAYGSEIVERVAHV